MATRTFTNAVDTAFETVGNWDTYPVDADSLVIAGNCNITTDLRTGPVLFSNVEINDGFTLTIDGRSATAAMACLYFKPTAGTTVAYLDFKCNTASQDSAILEAATIDDGAVGAYLHITTSVPGGGTVEVSQDWATASRTLELRGVAAARFKLILNGSVTKRSLIITEYNTSPVSHVLDYIDISGGATYAIEVTESAFELTNFTFDGTCDRNLFIDRCNPRYVKIENGDFGPVGNRNTLILSSQGIVCRNTYWDGSPGYPDLTAQGSSVFVHNGAFSRASDGSSSGQSTNGARIDGTSGGRITCVNVHDNSAGGSLIDSGGAVDFIGERTHSGGYATDRQKWASYIEKSGTSDFAWFIGNNGVGTLDLDDDANSAPTEQAPFIVPFEVLMTVDTETTFAIDVGLSTVGALGSSIQLIADPAGTCGTSVTDSGPIVGNLPTTTELSVAYTPTEGTTGDLVVVPVELHFTGNANGVTAEISGVTVDGAATNTLDRAPDPALGHGWFVQAAGSGSAAGAPIIGGTIIN